MAVSRSREHFSVTLQFFGLRRRAGDASRVRPSLHPPVGRPHLVKDLERDPPVGDVGRDCLGAMFVLLRAATDHGWRAVRDGR